MTKVANSTPNPRLMAMGMRKRAWKEGSNIMGASPMKVVREVSRMGRNRRSPARQTADSTLNIKERIEELQGATGGTALEIDRISAVIREVNDIVAAIATAVEEQSSATREIADNVSQASAGVREVNGNVSRSSAVAGRMAQDVARVNDESGEILNASNRVNTRAEELKGMAETLNGIVNKFKV